MTQTNINQAFHAASFIKEIGRGKDGAPIVPGYRLRRMNSRRPASAHRDRALPDDEAGSAGVRRIGVRARGRMSLLLQGFDLRPDGRLVMPDGDGGILFSLSTNVTLAAETTSKLTLLLDVPCVAPLRDGFGAMIACARMLAFAIGRRRGRRRETSR